MNSNYIKLSLLLIIITSIQACGKVENPKFKRLDAFGIRKIDMQNVVVGFNAAFFNPNNFGVNVKEAAFDIYADSLYLGKFVQPRETIVHAGSEFSIPMEGTISLQQALGKWKGMLGKEVLLKGTGDVKVGKAGVFVSKKLDFQGRHKLDMNLLKNPAGAGF